MDQAWFEMIPERRRNLNSAVWIPLRADHTIDTTGRAGFLGFREDYLGVRTLAVPLHSREAAQKLGWQQTAHSRDHRPSIDDGVYRSSDVCTLDENDGVGIHLVLYQHLNRLESDEWYLHQDLVLGLGLKREGDKWLSANEGYIEVARLQRKDGTPTLLEIRSEHLKDYLCARGMALYVTSYRQRQAVVHTADFILWKDNEVKEKKGSDLWIGRVQEIHEGGRRFGSTTAVFHLSRTDVDPTDDVPTLGLPTDANVTSASRMIADQGKRLIRVLGELWRCEWVEPAAQSPRVRGDRVPSTVSYIADAEGQRETRGTLTSGKWFWFRPEVMLALAHRRGAGMKWHTRDTGTVWCSPDYGIHFGINALGLINAYAKDIVRLPEWQQQVWAGHNVSPEGGVSEELLLSQVQARPADTQAPEAYLGSTLQYLGEITKEKLGATILRPHKDLVEILTRTHRFRAVDCAGLFALAKDVTRLTADSIDASVLQKHFAMGKNETLGSLKSLERLLATKLQPDLAHKMLGPLAGIYELRLADAHLPRETVNESLALVGIDESISFIHQGYQLLDACVRSLCYIAQTIEQEWG